jgi:hypothetical protein
MRAGLTINLLFPIKDEPSAKLMSLKAELLCAAGVIDVVQKRIILERAATIVTSGRDDAGSRPAEGALGFSRPANMAVTRVLTGRGY